MFFLCIWSSAETKILLLNLGFWSACALMKQWDMRTWILGQRGRALYVLILKNTIQFKWFVNASRWFLLQPITLALVYVGTTLKDLSDVTHGWSEFSKTRWVRASSFFLCLGMLSFSNHPPNHMAAETKPWPNALLTTQSYMFIMGIERNCSADFIYLKWGLGHWCVL